MLTLPQGMSREREGCCACTARAWRIVESLGGMNEAVDAARALAGGDDVFLPDQFSNPANPEVHRRTTAPEISRRSTAASTCSSPASGTGGTITGVGEVLKERNPDARVVAVEPAGSAVLSAAPPGPHKIQGIGAGFVPAVLNREVIDEVIAVDDEDAIETARAGGPPRGRARAGSRAAPRCAAAIEVARAAGVAGQADRR